MFRRRENDDDDLLQPDRKKKSKTMKDFFAPSKYFSFEVIFNYFVGFEKY